jgi:hypothetical protein
VKFTQYFLYTRIRTDRAAIKLEWIEMLLPARLRAKDKQMGGLKNGDLFRKRENI